MSEKKPQPGIMFDEMPLTKGEIEAFERSMVSIRREPSDVVVIEGMRYSGQFFRDMSENGLPVGDVFKIVKREDGVLHLERAVKDGPE